MKTQYLVKRASLYAAIRNPYRPRQKIKRGRWIRFAEFDAPAEAMERAMSLRGGMSEVGIWYRGVQVAKQNKDTGGIEWLCVCTRECDCQDEPAGMTSNECPVHNHDPRPHPGCLAEKHWFQKLSATVKQLRDERFAKTARE